MARGKKNPKVEFYFTKNEKWQKELAKLRMIVLASGLTEELKWGVPCYTLDDGNVVLLHVFKAYCAILFIKGVLMKDPEGILIQQTENVQSGRQIRFANVREIVETEDVLKAYIDEAIELEKSGVKLPHKKTAEYPVAEEFQIQLDEHSKLKAAFESLTPGRQHGYLLHFAAPKQSKTLAAKVEKAIPQILKGKGLDDD